MWSSPAEMADKPLFIRLSLPNGLEDSLESLAREVLRSQPKNIYQFAAQHFEELVKKRNLEQGLPEDKDLSFFIHDHLSITPCDDLTAAGTAVGIGGAGDKVAGEDGTELESLSGRESSEGNGEMDFPLNDPDFDAAATKIQAGFRGSKARRNVKELRESESVRKAIEIQMPNQVMTAAAEEEEADDGDGSARAEEEEAEEELDIDLADPEVDKAATKIQAGFRGMKTRKELKSKRTNEPEEEENEGEAVEAPIGEEEAVDEEELTQAATAIQAGYRGHMARKEVKKRQEIIENRTNIPKSLDEFNKMVEDEIVDVDLSNPEVEKAATTIQAGYRGMRTRKDVAKKKEEKTLESEEAAEEESPPVDPDDPEVVEAATKIQAGYKGYKTRKEMREKKEAQAGEEEAASVKKRVQFEPEVTGGEEDAQLDEAATKIQAGYRGMKTRKELREKSAPIAVEAAEAPEEATDLEAEMAATKIQAGYRGMKVRKDVKKRKEETEVEDVAAVPVDDDLFSSDDPEVVAAATTIQAGYRGMKARKGVKGSRQNDQTDADDASTELDLADPEVEMAATKIQAGYKGYQARKRVARMKDEGNVIAAEAGQALGAEEEGAQDDRNLFDINEEDPDVINAATKIQAGYRGMKVRRQPPGRREDKEAVLDAEDASEADHAPGADDDEEAAMAATKIQAGYRGMKVRKEMKRNVEGVAHGNEEAKEEKVEDEVDIDLEDPEVQQAASKIQAGFKGHMARKKVIATNNANEEEDVTEAIVDSLNDDQDVNEEAAAKIGDEMADDDNPEDLDAAATKIQAGFRGMKARKEVAARKQDDCEITIVSQVHPTKEVVAESVVELGAIPFDMHPSAASAEIPSLTAEAEDEEEEKKKVEGDQERLGSEQVQEGIVLSDSFGGGKEVDTPLHRQVSVLLDGGSGEAKDNEKKEELLPNIMIYHYRASYNSQKVLLYLYERGIRFTAFHVDLQRNEHLSPWFLQLNPKGEVPVMKLDDQVVADSTRIMHLLEAKVPVDAHPPLVPCTSDTRTYQMHVYFIALLDQIPLNPIAHGLAYHPHLSSGPAPPYDDEDTLSAIRQMLENRAASLRLAAEDALTAIEDKKAAEAAAADLRAKADAHEKEVLPRLKDATGYEEMLNQTAATLDKIEEQLASTASSTGLAASPSPPSWLLGPSFSACDVALGVILNRLACIGLHQRFWLGGGAAAGEESDPQKQPRKHVHKFLQEIQKRASFAKAVPEWGSPDVGGVRREENGLRSADESMEVWHEIQKGISREEGGGGGGQQTGDANEEGGGRTWKSLW